MWAGSFFKQGLSSENADFRIQVPVRLNLVELKEQPFAPTLAHKLSGVPDVPEIEELFRVSQPKVLALISNQIP